MIVAVFGSASPKEGEELYTFSWALGKALGEQRHTVVTGGYCGTMEGTLKGALENQYAYTIGVTCDEIEAYRPGRANPYVLEEMRIKTLHERIDLMTHLAEAIIALPGGIGTMAEIMLAYNQMVIGVIKVKPFILVGEAWAAIFERFFEEQGSHIPAFARDLLSFVNTVDEAVLALEKYDG